MSTASAAALCAQSLPNMIAHCQQMQQQIATIQQTPCGTAITNSRMTVLGMGRVYLCDCIASCEPEFDPILISDLSPKCLAILVWLLCGVSPNVKLTSLRAITFEQVATMCSQAKVRLHHGNPETCTSMVQGLLKKKCEDQYVFDLAATRGFQEEFFFEPEHKRFRCVFG